MITDRFHCVSSLPRILLIFQMGGHFSWAIDLVLEDMVDQEAFGFCSFYTAKPVSNHDQNRPRICYLFLLPLYFFNLTNLFSGTLSKSIVPYFPLLSKHDIIILLLPQINVSLSCSLCYLALRHSSLSPSAFYTCCCLFCFFTVPLNYESISLVLQRKQGLTFLNSYIALVKGRTISSASICH